MTTLTSTTVTVCLPRAASPGSPARTPLPAAARDLVASARRSLTEAVIASTPCERYAAAHLAALRAAAAVLPSSLIIVAGGASSPPTLFTIQPSASEAHTSAR